ncbi:MAG: M48 family metalloprotease [Desulfobacterales bacterium]|nr:M48 family metalloprotease [Desulfobacterales bacterium]
MNKFKKIISLLLTGILIQSGSISAAHAFSIGEERELGEKLLYSVRASFPILGEPDLHQYINGLGQEVLQVAGLQFFDYRFYIVDSNQFNAFAAPSGLIFFYTKLIESMNSEDELVSVLAHEIGHVVKRHLASRMKKGKAINIASLGLALAAIAFGGAGAATQTLLAGSLAAGQSAQLYFSRQDEMEADLLAYKWIKDLDRNTDGQKEMLRTMRRITRYRSGQIPQYLLTHPDPEARLNYVESLIFADNSSSGSSRTDKMDFAFLRFKYRIMSVASKNESFRAYLVNKMADSRSSETDIIMASYGLSQLDRQANNFDNSLKQLSQVIDAFPEQNILLVDKGILYSEMGELDQAKIILEGALNTDVSDMYAAFNLAKVLLKTNELKKAEELFRIVSYQMPEFPQVYFEMGRIQAAQGRTLESRFNLGKYNLYEGKLKLAQANFKQVADNQDDGAELKKESEEMLELIERLKDS